VVGRHFGDMDLRRQTGISTSTCHDEDGDGAFEAVLARKEIARALEAALRALKSTREASSRLRQD
jgi:hypothetical protein